MINTIKRGEIYYTDLGTSDGSHIQTGIRPVIVVQNDLGQHT